LFDPPRRWSKSAATFLCPARKSAAIGPIKRGGRLGEEKFEPVPLLFFRWVTSR
jgi:hypothetical protein